MGNLVHTVRNHRAPLRPEHSTTVRRRVAEPGQRAANLLRKRTRCDQPVPLRCDHGHWLSASMVCIQHAVPSAFTTALSHSRANQPPIDGPNPRGHERAMRRRRVRVNNVLRVGLDVHALGRQQTGNETYMRELVASLATLDEPGVEYLCYHTG